MASIRTRVKCDVGAIQSSIKQVGDRAVRGISAQMRGYGERMRDQAELNAPFDTGSLENAIEIKYERSGINRRMVVTIFVNLASPYYTKKGESEKKNVGDYAQKIERGLAPYGSGKYRPGKGTIAKGQQAGGKFIRRAVDQYRDELMRISREIVKREAARRRRV